MRTRSRPLCYIKLICLSAGCGISGSSPAQLCSEAECTAQAEEDPTSRLLCVILCERKWISKIGVGTHVEKYVLTVLLEVQIILNSEHRSLKSIHTG